MGGDGDDGGVVGDGVSGRGWGMGSAGGARGVRFFGVTGPGGRGWAVGDWRIGSEARIARSCWGDKAGLARLGGR